MNFGSVKSSFSVTQRASKYCFNFSPLAVVPTPVAEEDLTFLLESKINIAASTPAPIPTIPKVPVNALAIFSVPSSAILRIIPAA